MLRWLLGPKCPVNVREKVWTDRRMNWLVEQFGIERMLRAEVILPTPDYFPDPYEGTHSDVRRILDRLCEYMQIDPTDIDLEFFTERQHADAVGLYTAGERLTVSVLETQLADPEALVATLVHELAHVLLLGGGLLSPDVDDHEFVTDLLPVFLGLGIFLANAVLRESWATNGRMYWWGMSKQGYLTARYFGYAFGLFAWRREEHDPRWKQYLRPDVRRPFEHTLSYLWKTGDSFFQPSAFPVRYENIGKIIAALSQKSPNVRLDALWSVNDFGKDALHAVPAIAACLQHPDPILRAEAAQALARIGPTGSAALPSLLAACDDRNDDVRAAVATALGTVASPSPEVATQLTEFLSSDNWRIVEAAARAVARLGPPAAEAGKELVFALRRAIINCDHGLIDNLADALIRISDEPRSLVKTHLDYDAEICRQALHAIRLHQRSENEPDTADA